MLVQHLSVIGLRGTGDWNGSDLGADVVLPRAPAGIVIADALSMFVRALEPDGIESGLDRMGLSCDGANCTRDEHGMLEQVTGFVPESVMAFLGDERRLVLRVGMTVDPPLYGTLRKHAVRDPNMVTALGQDPVLRMKVGWLWAYDRTAASVSLLEVGIGDVRFGTAGSDRPVWLTSLCQTVASRFQWIGGQTPVAPLAESLLSASLSADTGQRAAFHEVVRTLQAPPFDLGRLALVREGDRLVVAFGDELVRMRRLGAHAGEIVRLVAAVLVQRPDILILEDAPNAAVRKWLHSRTQGADATLEQVWCVERAGESG